jgi:NADH-quinone oxidoreductase subunit J
MKIIGQALVGTEKYQYLLPFEILGILLLACAIGGILIARKR